MFYKVREEGADLYKALMIYPNMPLTSRSAISNADPAK